MAEIGTKINTHVTKQQLYVVSAKCWLQMGEKPCPAESLEMLEWEASGGHSLASHADKFAFIP